MRGPRPARPVFTEPTHGPRWPRNPAESGSEILRGVQSAMSTDREPSGTVRVAQPGASSIGGRRGVGCFDLGADGVGPGHVDLDLNGIGWRDRFAPGPGVPPMVREPDTL